MRTETLIAIEESAIALWELNDPSVLSGVKLTAWVVCQILKKSQHYIRAADIATQLDAYHGIPVQPETVRSIVRALMAGGVAIESNRRWGYRRRY